MFYLMEHTFPSSRRSAYMNLGSDSGNRPRQAKWISPSWASGRRVAQSATPALGTSHTQARLTTIPRRKGLHADAQLLDNV